MPDSATPLSPKPRRRWSRRRLALLSLLGLALLVGIVHYRYSRTSLSEFVGQDLRKLNDVPNTLVAKVLAKVWPGEPLGPRSRLKRLLKETLPGDFADDRHAFFGGYEPWYVWRLDDRYLLFQAQSLFMIPGSSTAAVHFFDSSETYRGHSAFSTGWRIDILDAALVNHSVLEAPVIDIRTGASLNGRDVGRQFYGVFDDRVALLRIENSKGTPIANEYRYPNHQLGPVPPTRTEEEWEQLLHAPDRRLVLEALTWIGGSHWDETDGRDVSREEETSLRLAATLQRKQSVRKKFDELAASENRWVREAAVLAQKQVDVKR